MSGSSVGLLHLFGALGEHTGGLVLAVPSSEAGMIQLDIRQESWEHITSLLQTEIVGLSSSSSSSLSSGSSRPHSSRDSIIFCSPTSSWVLPSTSAFFAEITESWARQSARSMEASGARARAQVKADHHEAQLDFYFDIGHLCTALPESTNQTLPMPRWVRCLWTSFLGALHAMEPERQWRPSIQVPAGSCLVFDLRCTMSDLTTDVAEASMQMATMRAALNLANAPSKSAVKPASSPPSVGYHLSADRLAYHSNLISSHVLKTLWISQVDRMILAEHTPSTADDDDDGTEERHRMVVIPKTDHREFPTSGGTGTEVLQPIRLPPGVVFIGLSSGTSTPSRRRPSP